MTDHGYDDIAAEIAQLAADLAACSTYSGDQAAQLIVQILNALDDKPRLGPYGAITEQDTAT